MLFIGGSQDGNWVEIEPRMDRVRFPVATRPSRSLKEMGQSASPEYDEYDRIEFSVEAKSYYIYKLSTLTPQQTFETLLAGYRPYK